jgi:nucleotide-binding universal stress UspA family protein
MLFAVDETEPSRAALPLVATFARGWGADLHVLHVHARDGEPARTEAAALVTEMVDALSGWGIAAGGQVHIVRRGDPVGAVIARVARMQEADVVAVGSHGRTGLQALLEPSVSHRVATELSVPVLVVRVAPGLRADLQRVLVAIDASPGGELALADAVRAARPVRAIVRVIHVQEPAEGGFFVLERDREASRVVEQGLDTIRGCGMEADSEIVLADGSVGQAIAEAARRFDADLVVVASRRPPAPESFLVGSVALDLIHCLERPVLLAHRG